MRERRCKAPEQDLRGTTKELRSKVQSTNHKVQIINHDKQAKTALRIDRGAVLLSVITLNVILAACPALYQILWRASSRTNIPSLSVMPYISKNKSFCESMKFTLALLGK